MISPDRVAFTVFGKDIYWYGVLMAVGIVLAVLIAMREERRKKLEKDIVIDMCLIVIPAGVVGARLYYVLFELEQYLQDPISILYIWEGGLAIYGAVIGGLLAALIFAKVRKVRFLTLADIIAPGLVLAQAIGRWGNFFNQEAYGLPVTADMLAKTPILNYFPFSVAIEGTHYFDKAVCTACATAANGAHLHLATFFYESAWCLLVFIVIMLVRKRLKHDGDAFLLYALLYSLERTFVEGLRGDSLWIIKPSAPGLADGVRVSQALSAVLFVGILAFFIVRALREKKEGRLMWPKPLAVTETADAETTGAEATGAEATGATEASDDAEEANQAEKTPEDETGENNGQAETTDAEADDADKKDGDGEK